MKNSENLDLDTVLSFGDEWHRHNQSALGAEEHQDVFKQYFAIFPWDRIGKKSEGFDMGCGSGRWAKLVAPKIGKLHCIDAAEAALAVAKKNLADIANVDFEWSSVDRSQLLPASQDFGYSLGVLHHIPNTQEALNSCVLLLKPGAPMLVYLYYSFDNRPSWFRVIWKLSNLLRLTIIKLSPSLKSITTDLIAASVYWPLARLSFVVEKLGANSKNFPLYAYRDKSFYTMRTDSRDRFGTPLEQRFSRAEISVMMERAGLENIRFSNAIPYWCAVGDKKK
jgi:ubiquinone/menaquinone biosynthesis C-methylase UbiE